VQVIKSIWCTEIPARANIWCDCRRRAAATGQRNGYDRTELFSEPFRGLTAAGLPAMVLDGEIAVPDERGVTHLDALSEAISAGRQSALPISAWACRERNPPAATKFQTLA